ncbi:MAG TPA: polyprenyl synthetase family protein [Thermohalobaculum sp.]|nr:polyprenyl synthetase family protein [Thermohalobaculum sp.]
MTADAIGTGPIGAGASGTGGSGAPGPFERLVGLVEADLARVNVLVRERMASEHAPRIPEISAHLIEAGGKRLRPILTLAAARLCGYRGADHVKLAASVEFIHTATLLHDDVIDESRQRRGRATANLLWDNKSSVLVGDYLFARAFQLMVETGAIRVLRILSDASAVIAEGEVLQLTTAHDLSTDPARHDQVIRGKTAALFAAATEVGGVIAGAADPETKALRVYGDGLGMAFQLTDDLLDYGGSSATLGKDTGDDFRQGKVTLPVILAYRRGDEAARAFWRRAIVRGPQEPGDLAEALAHLEATGALAETQATARRHADRALAALAAFPSGALRTALEDIAEFVVARTA